MPAAASALRQPGHGGSVMYAVAPFVSRVANSSAFTSAWIAMQNPAVPGRS